MSFLFECSMQLEISRVGYKVEHEKNILKMTSFAIFRSFPTIFRRFSKILQTLSEGRFRNLRRLPKISDDNRGLPKTSEEVPKMFRSYIQLLIDIITVKNYRDYYDIFFRVGNPCTAAVYIIKLFLLW